MPRKILICDAVGSDHDVVRRLYEQLHQAFPDHELLVDAASGTASSDVLKGRVRECDAMVAVIAERDRLDAVEGRSGGWLRTPKSFVRIEIEEALRLSKPIVSVLVGNAPLPQPDHLPRAIRPLTSHPAVNLTPREFGRGADQIVGFIRRALTGTTPASPEGADLDIPSQGYGPHFEIDQDGVIRFAPPGALDRQGNNVDRLGRMHPPLRELSAALSEELGRGNVPHGHLLERSKAYHKLVDRALEEIDFALLYVEGVRLANAERAIAGEFELPPLDAAAREKIDSLLQLHGAFILASREGLEAYEAEQRYRRSQKEEAEYREAAIDFANRLQKQPGSVDPAVASAALDAAGEIGRGVNPERSGSAATGFLRNLTVTFSAAAAMGTLSMGALTTGSAALITVTTAATLVAAEGLKKSKPFAALTALVTQGIDSAGQADFASSLGKLGERFKAQLELFRSAEQTLTRLSSGREDFKWLRETIDWIENRVGAKPTKLEEGSPQRSTVELPPAPLQATMVGNLYLAKVVRVEQALQSAFVDFGGNRIGFLAFADIHPDYYQLPIEERQRLARFDQRGSYADLDVALAFRDSAVIGDEPEPIQSSDESTGQHNQYSIAEVIKRRQVMLVQVTKDERGNKGAALTTFLSLAGKSLVLMPNTAVGIRISGDVSDAEDRLISLKMRMEVQHGMGIFVRAAANDIPDSYLIAEYRDLTRTWESIRDCTLKSQAPALVYDATDRVVPYIKTDGE